MTESDSEEPLSPREEKFLRALSEGDMRKAASVLCISPATLRTMGPSYLRWLNQKRTRIDDDARQGLDFLPSPSSGEGPPFPREEELAHLLLAGNYSEAAKRLCISEETVRSKAPYLLELWERRRAATVEPQATEMSLSDEMPTRTERMGEGEANTPHTAPARRRIPGKGKPRSLK